MHNLPLSSGHDGIYNFNDSVQGWVSTYGHISATEVIVYGSNHSHNVKISIFLNSLFINLFCKEVSRERVIGYYLKTERTKYICIF